MFGAPRLPAVAIGLALAIIGCASSRASSCPETPDWPASPKSLVRQVAVDAIPGEFMDRELNRTTTGKMRESLEQFAVEETAKLKSKLQPGDQVWFYREEKCSGCGWFR